MTFSSKEGGDDFTTMYETIRSYVLEGNSNGSKLGLSVILRDGMVFWMEVVSRSLEPSAPSFRPRTDILSSQGCSEVVNILANMAYFSLQEEGVV